MRQVYCQALFRDGDRYLCFEIILDKFILDKDKFTNRCFPLRKPLFKVVVQSFVEFGAGEATTEQEA
jgi:hypothetical protein